MITEETIEKAGHILAKAAKPPVKVILFGSHAKGIADDESDLDLLVIEQEVEDRFDEMVRLRRELNQLHIPADVIVVSKERLEEWGDVDGTMLSSALTEGRVIAEA